MLDKIAQGHPVDGMEALSPVLVDGMELLIDLLPTDTHVLICDPELVRGRAIELVKTSEEFLHASWAAAAGGGKAPIDLGASAYQPLAEVRAAALAEGWRGGRCRRSALVRWIDSATDAGQFEPYPDRGRGDHRSLGSGQRAWRRVADGAPARSARPIAATPRRRSTRSPSGSVTAGASSSWPKAGAPPTGSSKCSVSTRCPSAACQRWMNGAAHRSGHRRHRPAQPRFRGR